MIDLVTIHVRLEPEGYLIPWVDEMRYLGLFIVPSHTFKRSLDHAKRSFYRAVDGFFWENRDNGVRRSNFGIN